MGIQMEQMSSVLLAINGGSSSVKFAVFDAANPTERLANGEAQRVGQPGASISARGLGDDIDNQAITAADHGEAAGPLIAWLKNRLGNRQVAAIGHRIVHGGLHLRDHCVISDAVLQQLRDAREMDLAHLPREIALIESFAKAFPGAKQVACLDTAFFKELPTVSRLLPIPRRFFNAGVSRFGFHGLSYTYLMGELARLDPQLVSQGKVVLAHLGSGASMAAVVAGKPIDTSMSFTPTAGLMMGTRCGDLDPGTILHLMRQEKLSIDGMTKLLNKQSGLLGVSETSADMRDLIERRTTDPRAAEAVDLFCYTARKLIGSFAAAMGGLDAIIFAGGIGEHSVEARAGICAGLQFLGVAIDPSRNATNSPVISAGTVPVRIIRTDEEAMIARICQRA
jgi:acetate kinase